MRSLAFRVCKRVLEQHNVVTRVKAADVGGTKRVILDKRESANPLFQISPALECINRGFLARLKQDRNLDFLDARLIRPLLGKYKLVYCFDTLEHVENPFLWVKHLLDITAPGGHVYLSTVFSFPYHPSPKDYWRFSPDALRMLFERFGGTVLECRWEDATKRSVMVLAEK